MAMNSPRRPYGLGLAMWSLAGIVSCELGPKSVFSVGHGLPDRRVMTTDGEGEWLLTSDVDARLFRVFGTDGVELDTLPWSVLGAGSEVESANGPFNAAASAFDRSGFFVASGDSTIHWVFPLFGQFTAIDFDDVPPVPESTGRARVCDMSSGTDGSLYVLTSERRDSLDWWARGSAWIHRRSPSGSWTRRNVGVHVYYASSYCGMIAMDALNDELFWLDQYRNSIRSFDASLTESPSVSFPDARRVRDVDALAGHLFMAMCETPSCLGAQRLRIFTADGELTDSEGTQRLDALAIERPPLPIGNDVETGLWAIRGEGNHELTRYDIDP